MTKAKVVVSLDEKILREVDRLVAARIFLSRSKVIEEALQEKLDQLSHERLSRECAKLDPESEKEFAEEGVGWELDHLPEY